MTQGALIPRLPGQLDLIAKVDIDRHSRKRTGIAVTGPALYRAQGLLTLLPQSMVANEVVEGPDGSVQFTWVRQDEEADILLRMCCLPHGGVRYWYSVKGRNGGEAGGVAWETHSHEEVLMRVRHVVALLTPKVVREGPKLQEPQKRIE
jgi:hypothetical protein